MQVAIDQFRVNLARVRNLGGIYNTLNAQTTAVIDCSDILRSELVMAVSVLDYYIHEIVRLGMLEVYRGTRSNTPAFLQFQISLESVRQAVSAPTSDDWLENEIRERHSWRSFQQAKPIADVIRLISDISLWEQVSNHLAMPAQDVRQQLNFGSYKKKVQNAKRNCRGGVSPPVVRVGGPNPYKNSVSVARFLNMSLNFIADRRNKIVHEADMDPTPYDTRWPIDEVLVDDAINFIEQIAETIYDLLTT